jgi:hypothetical protein
LSVAAAHRSTVIATNPALLKLTWDGRWDACREASQPTGYKSRTGGHYHIRIVRDPGGPQQVADAGSMSSIWALRANTSTSGIFAASSMKAGMRSGSSDADLTAAGATRCATYR